MSTHRLVISLRQTRVATTCTCALIALTALICLPVRVPAQDTCTGFAGTWSWPQGTDKLTISVQGDYAEGVLRSWKMKGTVTNGVLAGDWVDQVDPAESGTFTVNLFPAEHRIRVTLYNKQKLIHSSDFFCQPAQTQPPVKTGPSESLRLLILLKKFGSHDTDNFRNFDALPKADREWLLTQTGPRLPLEYAVNDLSLRVFVRGGWPLVLDYGLDSDAAAELSISAEGADPLHMRVEPAERGQVRIALPGSFGARPQVGKLRIVANKTTGAPAKFSLYGFAMGEGGVQALRKVSAAGSGGLLALMNFRSGPAPGYDERIPLFAPINPQENSSIQITLPTKIKPKQKPKQLVRFSFTFHSNFNGGRWEFWYGNALGLKKVWENKIRSIAPRQTARNEWDGITSVQKKILAGRYLLQLNAWRGLESEGDWALIRTSSAIEVEAP